MAKVKKLASRGCKDVALRIEHLTGGDKKRIELLPNGKTAIVINLSNVIREIFNQVGFGVSDGSVLDYLRQQGFNCTIGLIHSQRQKLLEQAQTLLKPKGKNDALKDGKSPKFKGIGG